MSMHVELQATCSALGYLEGKKYIKEPDCLETVKDLIRFLKREDETCDIRRQLGHAQIVQNDLLPLLKHYKDDNTLWETIIRLLVNLTQPGVLCFNGFVPTDKSLRNNYLEVESHLQAMKEAFIDEEVFSVLTEKLGELLKLDWENRQEEHRLLIERMLILIRNVLHVPSNPETEQRTDDDASVHDQVLWAIHVSGLEDLLLYISSSDEERNLSMHVLEIVSLMFREQLTSARSAKNPEVLATAGSQRSQTEKQKDEKELEMVREQEQLKKKANVRKISSRHSRFGGTFVVKNFKSISENDLICHRAQVDVEHIELDKNKKPKKKAKNRKPLIDKEVNRRSTLSIRLGLKEFCVQFLENCYNPMMFAVKDILNREKSQEHDETYYMWAMRFFMEFCRLYNHQVDFVSETMSVQTFHYIQVQLYTYYEMQSMEKKEAITWGKRAHLALKAYQELLLTLDSMDKSGNETLIGSSKVIKSNIFYVPEFRDTFLTLLRLFNESRFSRSYLKDLIETTHLFLKMLEGYTKKTGHLVVQSKKKKSKKKARAKPREVSGVTELSGQELEDLWDEISSELSAIFQGRGDVPDNVAPFDAASEIDVDQQRVDAMIRIQDCLRNKDQGQGVALFRAAREVWPERNEFGTPDISPEDEFMALREIFMTDLPRPVMEVTEPMEEEAEIDDDEEMQAVVTSESAFVFREFVVKFAKPEILRSYVTLLADFQTNSTHTNHCCVKLLHRVAVDLGYVGMLFQISLFRVFQKILNSPLISAKRYKELAKFSVYIVGQFVDVAINNPKAYMELWFWKTNKESIELVEGYGSYNSKSKVSWDEQGEMEVRRLFEEYADQETEGKDAVDCIMENITDTNKTRGQVIRELKRQELISSAKDLKRPKGSVKAWREEDEIELRELFEKFKDDSDSVGSIMAEMSKKRSRPAIMKKIVSMELVDDRKDLFKRRGKSGPTKSRRRRRGDSGSEGEELQELRSDYEEDVPGHANSGDSDKSADSGSDGDTESDGQEGEGFTTPAGNTIVDIITDIVKQGYKDQIKWIQRRLNMIADDREEEGTAVPVPLVPLTEENETAMEDHVFLSFLRAIGLSAPANEQEVFWRIPIDLTSSELRNIAGGLTLDENDIPVNAGQIQVRRAKPKAKKKEKKHSRNKKVVPKKNAAKVSVLQELIKKKAEAKKNKRSRRNESADTTVGPSTVENEDTVNDRQEKSSSGKKKRRVKKFVASDSDSDSDTPLRTLKSQRTLGPESPDNTEEPQTEERENKTDASQRDNSDVQGSEEESQTKPLLFLSSSDDSDNEPDKSESRKQTREGSDDENQSNKRSRSPSLSDDKGTDPPKKKARLLDSGDEDSETVREDTFPATLNTQGVDSDSDLDDHVPLRKAIQKRNIIESDEDE